MEIEQVRLGEDTLRHLSQTLAKGRALAKRLGTLPLNEGALRTFLPYTKPYSELSKLKGECVYSGIDRNEAHKLSESLDQKFAHILNEFLSAAPNRVVVFEQPEVTPAIMREAPIIKKDEKWNFCGESVYTIYTIQDVGSSRISDIPGIIPPWQFVVCGTSVPEGFDLPGNRGEISDKLLDVFAARAEIIASCANHDYIYIYWFRRENGTGD
jgi:hypothetical protein